MAAITHLGNVNFQDQSGHSAIINTELATTVAKVI